jgi:Bacterial Ig-like domain/L,D-transpeptidase catalytic domain
MSTYRAQRGANTALIVAVVAVVALVVGGVVAIAVLHSSPSTTSSGGAGSQSTAGGGSGSGKRATAIEAVSSTSPSSGATNVSPAGPITVHLTEPLAPGSPMPSISPNVAGSWSLTSSTTLTFEPSQSLVPFDTYTVTVPGGSNGLRGTVGGHLASNVKISFKVAPGSFLRLQELLAELNYLPVKFVPASNTPVPASQEALAQPGTFPFRWSGLPAPLQALFLEGDDDVLTQGAVMMFENLNGLATDGIAGPDVWGDLLKAVAQHQMDPNPWDWVYVQETPEPETVYVWSNGKMVFQTPANTGAVGFSTPNGSWPVYIHAPSWEMKGTNPNGTPYDDKGVLWVSYFYKGDALHAFLRGFYGVPQSLGCVEMPTAAAQTVYPYTPIGTVVTVQ